MSFSNILIFMDSTPYLFPTGNNLQGHSLPSQQFLQCQGQVYPILPLSKPMTGLEKRN